MQQYRLDKKIIIKGIIKAETGLAIGGSNSAMDIGGVDKGVIRNVATNEPYIPGSSLKGKMRSLLELRNGQIGGASTAAGVVKNGADDDYAHRAVKLFGNAKGEKPNKDDKGANETEAQKESNKQRPSRIIVRDACLNKEQVKANFFDKTDLPFTEVKTEVVIDRITSKAMPRQMERVPAGALFNFELVLNVFSEDNEKHLLEDIFASLQLVQDDYIGGSGSRGSGQVSFHIEQVRERGVEFYTEDKQEVDKFKDYQKFFPI
jgi:CRISPR-associated protein Csm3